MEPNHPIHRRHSFRLQEYDYTQPGAYFVTICVHKHEWLFGYIQDSEMILNKFGQIVHEEWFKTGEIRENVILHPHEFVIMPNHVHGIIWLDDVGERRRRTPTIERFGKPVSGSIPTIVRAFKSAATKRINELRNTPGAPVWQRNYYEHIIRDDDSLRRIREYILYNPRRWQYDRDNPDAQIDRIEIEFWKHFGIELTGEK